MSLVLIIPIVLLLPNWILLTFLIPLLMVMSFSRVLPELFSIGDADLQVYDIVLLISAYKMACSIILQQKPIHIYRIYVAIIVFVFSLFITTVMAYFRFGEELFWVELVSLFRFITQISTIFLLSYSVNNHFQLESAQKVISSLGYVIAATVYFNVIFTPLGIQLGEVQPTEGVIRYFGPLGDQVGFILPFFIYRQLVAGNLLRALFLAGAIVATGTIGAIVTLISGLIVMAVYMEVNMWRNWKARIAIIASFVMLIFLLFAFDFGSIRTRVTEGNVFQLSGLQRVLTVKLALQTFWENMIAGVGFTGFRYHAVDLDAEVLFIQELSKFSPIWIASTANQYLQVATDGGIIALAAFAWLIVVCLRTLKFGVNQTNDGLQELLQAGYIWLLALLIGAQTAAWLLPGSLSGYLLWLVLGMSLAARRIRVAESAR